MPRQTLFLTSPSEVNIKNGLLQITLEGDNIEPYYRSIEDIHIRYCTTLNNAMGHKRKITEKIFEHSQISIIFVADKQQNYSYHHWGSQRIKKANDKILKPLEMVEFI